MALESLFVLFMTTIGLPGTAVLAGGLGWWGFRNPTPNWPLVGLALAVLIAPLVLLAAVFGEEGIGMGIINPFFLPTVIVALALGMASYRHRR